MIEGSFEPSTSEMIVLTKDLYLKKEAEKRLYYDSRDKILRYQIATQVIWHSNIKNDDLAENGRGKGANGKFIEEGELPSIDSVISSNNSDSLVKLKVCVDSHDLNHREIDSYGKVKVVVRIKSKTFVTGLDLNDLKTHIFKALMGTEEIFIEVHCANRIVIKNLKLKNIPLATGQHHLQIPLSEASQGLEGFITIEFRVSIFFLKYNQS
jgi:hypothetical protein